MNLTPFSLKEKTAFPGVPFDARLPTRVPHRDVLAYLERYAGALRPLIQFGAAQAARL